ncbi:hypothetical protein MERGE_000397 [Pneumocystis wakefieldiae]|uniref:Uncharacterized protein n=1 Tax=Pneumocystis wakefieldiae TaxID=38082 RepID=A0A899FW22_9ASCO|nr:hypothetical protein MERGE_000397 [Pneumocystis wakefieldiae]
MSKSSSKLKREAEKLKRAAKSQAATAKNDLDSPGGLDLSMHKLSLGDRNATGVLTSRLMSRDIKIEQYSLSFHGRVLIENGMLFSKKRLEKG